MTILIVDDHPVVRKGLERFFKTTKYREATFLLADNGKEAVEIVKDKPVDIILLDISMPEMNGYDAAKKIMRVCPGSKILVLSLIDETPAIAYFFKVGARGYLTKGADETEIEKAIDSILEGHYWLDAKFDQQLIKIISRQSTLKPGFTPREMEIIVHLSKGKTNSQIGELLDLSSRTVETYRAAMISKANVNNTAELIHFVLRNGII